jgi:hypothetical protein
MRRAFVLGTKFRRIQNARLLMALKQSFQPPLYSLTTEDATRARIFPIYYRCLWPDGGRIYDFLSVKITTKIRYTIE